MAKVWGRGVLGRPRTRWQVGISDQQYQHEMLFRRHSVLCLPAVFAHNSSTRLPNLCPNLQKSAKTTRIGCVKGFIARRGVGSVLVADARGSSENKSTKRIKKMSVGDFLSENSLFEISESGNQA